MGAKAFALLAVGVAGVTAWDVMANPRCRRMLPWSDIIDCAINPPCSCPTVLHGGIGPAIESARRGGGYQEERNRRNVRGSGSGGGGAGAGGSGFGSSGLGGLQRPAIYKPSLDPAGAIGKLTQPVKLSKGPAKTAQQQQNSGTKHSLKFESRFSPETTFRPIRGMQTQNPPGGVRPRPQAACQWWDIICNLSKGKTIFGQEHMAIPGINPLNLPKLQIPTFPRLQFPVP